ncbi:MAG TPA: CHAT domain-containing protein [Thermoanaerobaculia bacterium]|nr:CHAT domain-containing protein [Thermoanaerobaculia bacterium]
MLYEDFFVQIHPPQGEDHPVTVHCPAGDGRGTFRIPLTPDEIQALKDGFDDTGADQAARLRPEEIGSRLFDALFTKEIRLLLAASLAKIPEDGEHGLRIKLCFDPEAMTIGQLPWEIVFWEERREFLSLGRTTPLVRYLNVPRGVRPRLTPPLRVLLASACPSDTKELDLEAEAKRIEEALEKIPGIQVRRLRNATPQSLRDKLLEEPFHILHFMGHGSFHERKGEGALLLEDEEGRTARLPGRVLAHLLRGFPSLQFAFLNACRTACAAREPGLDPFAGVASSLVLAGMPAVLAMQFSVGDDAALHFSRTFYRRIAAGDPVDTATTEGRMAVLLGDALSAEWATPALFLRAWDGYLFEPGNGSSSASVPASGSHDFSLLIQDKTEGFVGRRWVFDSIAQFTRKHRRGYFVLRGDPGIGKTALMAELVKRERFPHHFNIRTEGIQRPDQFLRNIFAQLTSTYGLDPTPLPPDATQSTRFLNVLLDKVAARLKPGEKAALVVDALDETDLSLLAPGANPLYLPGSLPAGLYIFVSTRRGDLPLRIECEQMALDIDQDSPHNLEDIREYVEAHLPGSGIRAYVAAQGLDDETFVTEMIGRSEGNFMYLRHVLPEIERGEYQGRSFKALPVGLQSYYDDHWRRMRARDEEIWFTYQLPVLVALTAVREPVSIADIGRFSGMSDRRRVRGVIDEWAQFLYVEQTQDESGSLRKRYRLYHSSFFEFIAAKDQVADERVNLAEAHRRIADALWDEP